MLLPARKRPEAIIVIPDADQTPEELAGLVPGVPPESQVARRLAESGYHVIVPALIDRTVAARNGRAKLTNREFVYRSAFELGRHVIGYEVQKVLALVDLGRAGGDRPGRPSTKIGVFGYGEGGAIALYAAALDPRIEPSASAAISTTATTSGGSRSIATSSACWNSSATPRSPA